MDDGVVDVVVVGVGFRTNAIRIPSLTHTRSLTHLLTHYSPNHLLIQSLPHTCSTHE